MTANLGCGNEVNGHHPSMDDDTAKRPRIMVEVPGYWTLPPEDRKRIDELMEDLARKRDGRTAESADGFREDNAPITSADGELGDTGEDSRR